MEAAVLFSSTPLVRSNANGKQDSGMAKVQALTKLLKGQIDKKE